jgi:hypothetical protein
MLKIKTLTAWWLFFNQKLIIALKWKQGKKEKELNSA